MFGAPTTLPEVGCRALIAPVSYVQWMMGAVGGLSIPYWGRGVKRRASGHVGARGVSKTPGFGPLISATQAPDSTHLNKGAIPPWDAPYGVPRGHPRGAGMHAKILRLVCEKNVVPLMEAIAKMSYLLVNFLGDMVYRELMEGKMRRYSLACWHPSSNNRLPKPLYARSATAPCAVAGDWNVERRIRLCTCDCRW
jgi:hypothetical protein